MELTIVTVGQLRAELVGWPDESPVVVFVPDRHNPMDCAVREIASAGADLTSAAAVLANAFPLMLSPRPLA